MSEYRFDSVLKRYDGKFPTIQEPNEWRKGLKDFVVNYEKYKPDWYQDGVQDKPTIGYGSLLLEGDDPNDPKYAPENHEKLLDDRLDDAILAANSRISRFKDLNTQAQWALVSAAYQMGGQGLSGFDRMIEAIDQGDFKQAGREALIGKDPNEPSKWVTQTPTRAREAAYLLENARFINEAVQQPGLASQTEEVKDDDPPNLQERVASYRGEQATSRFQEREVGISGAIGAGAKAAWYNTLILATNIKERPFKTRYLVDEIKKRHSEGESIHEDGLSMLTDLAGYQHDPNKVDISFRSIDNPFAEITVASDDRPEGNYLKKSAIEAIARSQEEFDNAKNLTIEELYPNTPEGNEAMVRALEDIARDREIRSDEAVAEYEKRVPKHLAQDQWSASAIAFNMTKEIFQMVPGMVASIGGGAAAGSILPGAGTAIGGVIGGLGYEGGRSYLENLREGDEMGLNFEQSSTRAAVIASIEGGTAYIPVSKFLKLRSGQDVANDFIDAFKDLKKKADPDYINKVQLGPDEAEALVGKATGKLEKLAKPVEKGRGGLGQQIVGVTIAEGAQEMGVEISAAIYDTMHGWEDRTMLEMASDIAYAAVLGSLVGGTIGGAGASTQLRDRAKKGEIAAQTTAEGLLKNFEHYQETGDYDSLIYGDIKQQMSLLNIDPLELAEEIANDVVATMEANNDPWAFSSEAVLSYLQPALNSEWESTKGRLNPETEKKRIELIKGFKEYIDLLDPENDIDANPAKALTDLGYVKTQVSDKGRGIINDMIKLIEGNREGQMNREDINAISRMKGLVSKDLGRQIKEGTDIVNDPLQLRFEESIRNQTPVRLTLAEADRLLPIVETDYEKNPGSDAALEVIYRQLVELRDNQRLREEAATEADLGFIHASHIQDQDELEDQRKRKAAIEKIEDRGQWEKAFDSLPGGIQQETQSLIVDDKHTGWYTYKDQNNLWHGARLVEGELQTFRLKESGRINDIRARRALVEAYVDNQQRPIEERIEDQEDAPDFMESPFIGGQGSWNVEKGNWHGVPGTLHRFTFEDEGGVQHISPAENIGIFKRTGQDFFEGYVRGELIQLGDNNISSYQNARKAMLKAMAGDPAIEGIGYVTPQAIKDLFQDQDVPDFERPPDLIGKAKVPEDKILEETADDKRVRQESETFEAKAVEPSNPLGIKDWDTKRRNWIRRSGTYEHTREGARMPITGTFLSYIPQRGEDTADTGFAVFTPDYLPGYAYGFEKSSGRLFKLDGRHVVRLLEGKDSQFTEREVDRLLNPIEKRPDSQDPAVAKQILVGMADNWDAIKQDVEFVDDVKHVRQLSKTQPKGNIPTIFSMLKSMSDDLGHTGTGSQAQDKINSMLKFMHSMNHPAISESRNDYVVFKKHIQDMLKMVKPHTAFELEARNISNEVKEIFFNSLAPEYQIYFLEHAGEFRPDIKEPRDVEAKYDTPTDLIGNRLVGQSTRDETRESGVDELSITPDELQQEGYYESDDADEIPSSEIKPPKIKSSRHRKIVAMNTAWNSSMGHLYRYLNGLGKYLDASASGQSLSTKNMSELIHDFELKSGYIDRALDEAARREQELDEGVYEPAEGNFRFNKNVYRDENGALVERQTLNITDQQISTVTEQGEIQAHDVEDTKENFWFVERNEADTEWHMQYVDELGRIIQENTATRSQTKATEALWAKYEAINSELLNQSMELQETEESRFDPDTQERTIMHRIDVSVRGRPIDVSMVKLSGDANTWSIMDEQGNLIDTETNDVDQAKQILNGYLHDSQQGKTSQEVLEGSPLVPLEELEAHARANLARRAGARRKVKFVDNYREVKDYPGSTRRIKQEVNGVETAWILEREQGNNNQKWTITDQFGNTYETRHTSITKARNQLSAMQRHVPIERVSRSDTVFHHSTASSQFKGVNIYQRRVETRDKETQEPNGWMMVQLAASDDWVTGPRIRDRKFKVVQENVINTTESSPEIKQDEPISTVPNYRDVNVTRMEVLDVDFQETEIKDRDIQDLNEWKIITPTGKMIPTGTVKMNEARASLMNAQRLDARGGRVVTTSMKIREARPQRMKKLARQIVPVDPDARDVIPDDVTFEEDIDSTFNVKINGRNWGYIEQINHEGNLVWVLRRPDTNVITQTFDNLPTTKNLVKRQGVNSLAERQRIDEIRQRSRTVQNGLDYIERADPETAQLRLTNYRESLATAEQQFDQVYEQQQRAEARSLRKNRQLSKQLRDIQDSITDYTDKIAEVERLQRNIGDASRDSLISERRRLDNELDSLTNKTEETILAQQREANERYTDVERGILEEVKQQVGNWAREQFMDMKRGEVFQPYINEGVNFDPRVLDSAIARVDAYTGPAEANEIKQLASQQPGYLETGDLGYLAFETQDQLKNFIQLLGDNQLTLQGSASNRQVDSFAAQAIAPSMPEWIKEAHVYAQPDDVATPEDVDEMLANIAPAIKEKVEIRINEGREFGPLGMTIIQDTEAGRQYALQINLSESQSKKSVKSVIVHEVIGHMGLDVVIPASRWKVLSSIYRQLKETNSPEFQEIYNSFATRYENMDERTEIHEFIAHLAERNQWEGRGAYLNQPKSGWQQLNNWFKKVRSQLLSVLRNPKGFWNDRQATKDKYTVADLNSILRMSNAWATGQIQQEELGKQTRTRLDPENEHPYTRYDSYSDMETQWSLLHKTDPPKESQFIDINEAGVLDYLDSSIAGYRNGDQFVLRTAYELNDFKRIGDAERADQGVEAFAAQPFDTSEKPKRVGVDEKIYQPPANWASRQYRRFGRGRGHLPEALKEERDQANFGNVTAGIETQFITKQFEAEYRQYLGKYKKLKPGEDPDTEKQLVIDFLYGREKLENVPQGLQNIVSQMRAFIDLNSTRIMHNHQQDILIIRDQLRHLDRNNSDHELQILELENKIREKAELIGIEYSRKGEYMNRAYRIHTDSTWYKLLDKEYDNPEDRANRPNKQWVRDAIEEMHTIALKEMGVIDANGVVIDESWFEGTDEIRTNAQGVQEAVPMKDRIKQRISLDVWGMLENGYQYASFGNSWGSSRSIGNRLQGILTQRKELPPLLRKAMGEYTDPIEAFETTMAKQNDYIGASTFFQQIYKNFRDSGLIYPSREAAAKALDIDEKEIVDRFEQINFSRSESNRRNNPAYEPLAGWWMDKDVLRTFDDMNGVDAWRHPAALLVKAYIAQSKLSNTVRSPKTQARNFANNLFVVVGNGHVPLPFGADGSRNFALGKASVKLLALHQSPGEVEVEIFDGFEGTEGKPQSYFDIVHLLASNGVIGQSTTASDMESHIKNGQLDNIISYTESFWPSWLGGEKTGKAVAGTLKGVLKTDEFAKDLYGAGDDYWKVVAYMFELQKNVRDLDQLKKAGLVTDRKSLYEFTAKEVRMSMPTYAEVNQMLKMIRSWPLTGDFTSFTGELIRTFNNQRKLMVRDFKIGRIRRGTERLLGMSMSAGLMTAVLEIASGAIQEMAFGYEEDDDEESIQDDMRTLANDYQKDSGFFVTSHNKNSGVVKGVDLSNWFAHNTITYNPMQKLASAYQKGERQGHSLTDYLAVVFAPFEAMWTQTIASTALIEMMTGEDEYGDPVWKGVPSALDMAVGTLKSVVQPVVPAVAEDMFNIYQAGEGKKRPGKYGKPYEFTEEFLRLMGITSVTIDPGKVMRQVSSRTARQLRDLKKPLNQAIERGEMAEEEFLDLYNKQNKLWIKEQDTLKKEIDSALDLGTPLHVVKNQLKDAGLGEDLIKYLVLPGAGLYRNLVLDRDRAGKLTYFDLLPQNQDRITEMQPRINLWVKGQDRSTSFNAQEEVSEGLL